MNLIAGVGFFLFWKKGNTNHPGNRVSTMKIYFWESLFMLNAIMLELMLIATWERYQEYKRGNHA